MSRKKSPVQTGREMLAAWLDDRVGRVTELASALEVDTSTVWRWRHGLARPGGPARALLERIAGIPRDATWPQEGES